MRASSESPCHASRPPSVLVLLGKAPSSAFLTCFPGWILCSSHISLLILQTCLMLPLPGFAYHVLLSRVSFSCPFLLFFFQDSAQVLYLLWNPFQVSLHGKILTIWVKMSPISLHSSKFRKQLAVMVYDQDLKGTAISPLHVECESQTEEVGRDKEITRRTPIYRNLRCLERH